MGDVTQRLFISGILGGPSFVDAAHYHVSLRGARRKYFVSELNGRAAIKARDLEAAIPLIELMEELLRNIGVLDLLGVGDEQDILVSAYNEIKDKNLDVLAGYHAARDDVPPGNASVPSSDRINWNGIHPLIRNHVTNVSNMPLSVDDWNPEMGKKTYGNVIAAKLFNAELNGETSAAEDVKNLIRGAAVLGPWAVTGTPVVIQEADYDFAEVRWVGILWRFHHMFDDSTLGEILSLISSEGSCGIFWFGLFSDLNAYGFVIPETENHVFKIEASRYLKNKWMRDHGNTDPKYDNNTNGVAKYLVEYLDHTIKATVYEYHSNPYAESTLMALLNLEGYAEDAVKTKARQLLDSIMYKTAIGSLNGFAMPPMRRLSPGSNWYHDYDDITFARTHVANADQESSFPHWQLWGDTILGRGPIKTFASMMPYRMPQETNALMRSTNKDYFVALGRGKLTSPELYSAGPNYLLTAGGVIADKKSVYTFCNLYSLGPSCSDQVNRATHLKLDSLHTGLYTENFLVSGGNIRGSSGVILDENTPAGTDERDQSYGNFNNTCLYENFACGSGRVWIPIAKYLRTRNFSVHCQNAPSGVDLQNSLNTTENNLNQWCVYSSPRDQLHIGVYSSNEVGMMAVVRDPNASHNSATLLNNFVAANSDQNVLAYQFTWPQNTAGVPDGTISYDPDAPEESWAITGVSYNQDRVNGLSRDYGSWPQINIVEGSLSPNTAGVPNGTISYDPDAHEESWATTRVSYAHDRLNSLRRDYRS